MEAPLLSPTAYLLPPVTAVQPPDLDTDDPSLATEVLPAPPPLQSLTQRRDSHLKRPSHIFSYLPASDPGSTYSGLMGGLGLSLVPEDDQRLRKRTRVDKTAINNRAQRASARNLTPTVPPPLLSPPAPHQSTSTDSVVEVPPPDRPSRSRRDKGKARERPPARVKEEPLPVSLDMPEPPSAHPNDDHCSACRSHGALVYCDGCPRAFHLWCLDPPLDAQDVPEHRWYCPACVIRQHPPPRPSRSLLAPLLHQLQHSIPAEFELPEDIRNFFKDVATGPKGAYQDSSETKIVRSSRFLVQDEREPFRLKDRNGTPVLCFRCGKSALPDNDVTSGPSSSASARETRGRRSLRAPPGEVLWKSIVSCDHCPLHWHLDCLDPPLSSMPPTHKKWMCPAHIDHIAPKRRVPRQVPPVTDVTERNRPNNGAIEIIPADTAADRAKKMPVDEVQINGRRYRIPERVIVLDFWDKLGRGRKPPPTHGLLSGLSSPLTSLSSLDDIAPSEADSSVVSSDPPAAPGPDAETMRAVELLFACRTAVIAPAPIGVGIAPPRATATRMEVDPAPRRDTAVQTDPEGCVRLDVNDAKQLSGLVSAALQDLDRPETPSPPRTVLRPRTASVTKPRAVRPLPRRASGSLRKPAPAEAGSMRVTRSKAVPAPAPAPAAVAPTPPPRPKPEPSLPAPTPQPAPRATRSKAAASAAKPLPPADAVRAPAPTVRTPKRPADAAPATPAPLAKAVKSEPSSLTSVPSQPPSAGKSPFKIRIPLAMNTAVAAATAAAAAASSSEPPQKESDASSDSDAPAPSGPAATPRRRAPPRGNAGRRSAPSRKAAQPPATPPVLAGSTPARARGDVNPFDRSPQFTDITSDSSSDFDPGPRLKLPERRMVALPRGLGI